MMERSVLALIMVAVSISGCLNGARDTIQGVKTGLAECQHPGVMTVGLRNITYAPQARTWVLAVDIQNHYEGRLFFGTFGGLSVVASNSNKLVEGSWGAPGENRTLAQGESVRTLVYMPREPSGEWTEFSFGYTYTHPSRPNNNHPSIISCDLRGDGLPNAIWIRT